MNGRVENVHEYKRSSLPWRDAPTLGHVLSAMGWPNAYSQRSQPIKSLANTAPKRLDGLELEAKRHEVIRSEDVQTSGTQSGLRALRRNMLTRLDRHQESEDIQRWKGQNDESL